MRWTDIGCLLVIVFWITAVANADSKRIKDPTLSCKYYDSLSSNLNSCNSVNRGDKTEVNPEGKHKSLYQAALKVLTSSEEGSKIIEAYKGKLSFETWMVDLNDDGIQEAVLFPLGDFRGASGNGDIIVFRIQKQKGASSWKPIGFLQGHHVHVEPIKNSKYYALVTSWPMGAKQGFLTRYKMDVRVGKYIPSKKIEYSCILQSEEPCFR